MARSVRRSAQGSRRSPVRAVSSARGLLIWHSSGDARGAPAARRAGAGTIPYIGTSVAMSQPLSVRHPPVIPRESGRSSIPEILVVGQRGLGVLDTPLSRGMTTVEAVTIRAPNLYQLAGSAFSPRSTKVGRH